jgi:hypothetical protein
VTGGVAASRTFDLSGVVVRVLGLPEPVAGRMASEWKAFLTDEARAPFLEVRVDVGEPVPPEMPFAPKEIRGAIGPGGGRFEMPDGSVEITAEGIARVLLHPSDRSRTYYAFQNLLRAALARRLPERGGALLHAAGLVVDGNAFVLVGPEGSGKSTWAREGEAGGARVLSDDLVMLDGTGASFEALGAPFKSTYSGPLAPGRWPLAALLLPERGTSPSLATVARVEATARIVANLPFIAEGVATDPQIANLVERLATELPAKRLAFAPDPAFLPLLRELGRGPGSRSASGG